MNNITQLPIELMNEINEKAEVYIDHIHCHVGDMEHEAYIAGATEYATKLHQEQQENAELRQWKKEQLLVWGPLHEYGLSCDELKIGESISAFILNRCKRFEQAQKVFEKVIDLYDLTPEDELYNEIKTFLDGK